jgi:hypothetical protein
MSIPNGDDEKVNAWLHKIGQDRIRCRRKDRDVERSNKLVCPKGLIIWLRRR